MRPINVFLVLLFFIVHSVFSVSVIGQVTDADLATKVDEICASWEASGPGGVVGIVKDGQLVFSKAYGLASLEYDIPNTTSTIFNIASVSKQFTAFSMVLLEQQGKLSIDDDVRKYLPELPDFGTPITIRHLLNHISGLRNFQNLLGIAGWRGGESMTNDDLLRFISKQKELNYPVGSEYLYCNTGFVLATFIVERITGMSFQDWTKENIFLPLGMEHTEYREDMEAVHKNTATSYARNENGTYRQPLKYWTYMGNGNVYTTINDLAKWVDNFENPTEGGTEGIDRLIEPGILTNGDTLSYALGIGVSSYRGLKRYSHGGSVGGYRSNFVYFPEVKTGVIAIANYSAANPGGKVYELVDYYLEEHLDAPKAESPEKYVHVSTPGDVPFEGFENYVGEYLFEGVNINISTENEQRFFQAKGYTPVLPLLAASDTSYFILGAKITLYFPEKKEGEMNRLLLLRDDDRMSGNKIDPELSTPQNLQHYAGTYYSPEVDTKYELKYEEGVLTAHHQRHEKVIIHPVQKNALRGEAFYLRDIEVVRWPNGDIKGIKVSNGRVRNLWFERR